MVRVISWNIHGGRGITGRRNTNGAFSLINRFDPDVVCLQEVHRYLPWGAWENQPRRLAQQLGMRVWYMGCLQFAGLGEGILIASRLSCDSVTKLALPSVGEPRGLLAVRLRLSNQLPLNVMCTHWGLSTAERTAQSEIVRRKVNELDGAVVLCGDLNERADLAPVSEIANCTRLRDTFYDEPKSTYPSDNPSHRIDYCFASPELTVRSTHLLGSGCESDHLAIALELDFAKDARLRHEIA